MPTAAMIIQKNLYWKVYNPETELEKFPICLVFGYNTKPEIAKNF